MPLPLGGGKTICGFCRRGKEVEDKCGPLHVTKECIAHHKCMQYSACLVQYKFDSFGGFKIDRVVEEIGRGKFLKCIICKKGKNGKAWVKVGGATAGCAVAKCNKSYHYYCAKMSPTVITKRMEVTNLESLKKVVMYSVFCSERHQDVFKANKNNSIAMSESEEEESDGENNDGSESTDEDQFDQQREDSERTISSQVSYDSPSTSAAMLSQRVHSSPKKYEFKSLEKKKNKEKKDVKANANNTLEDLYLHLTQDSSASEVNSDDGNSSATSAGDLKSTPVIEDDSSLSSSDNDSVQEIGSRSRSSSLSSATKLDNKTSGLVNNKDLSVRLEPLDIELVQEVRARRHTEDSDSDGGEDSKKVLGIVHVIEDIHSAAGNMDIHSAAGNVSDIHGDYQACQIMTSKEDIKVETTSIGLSNDDKHLKRENEEEVQGSSISKRPRIVYDRSAALNSADENSGDNDDGSSEGYGSAKELSTKGAKKSSSKEKISIKPVNSKLPKHFGDVKRRPLHDCVLTFLEKECSAEVNYRKVITPVATKLYNVNQDSIYLWQYETEEKDMTYGHMIYFLKDITKALRIMLFEISSAGGPMLVKNALCAHLNKVNILPQWNILLQRYILLLKYRNITWEPDLSMLSELLLKFDVSKILKYDKVVEFNKQYESDITKELYHKLRLGINDNLSIACENLNHYVGSIHFFKSLGCHVMFLYLSDNVDEDRQIRNMLGHKRAPYVWPTAPDECNDVDLIHSSEASAKLEQQNEFEILFDWFKSDVRNWNIVSRPTAKVEPFLLADNVDSVTRKLKQKIKTLSKAKSSSNSEASDVVFIGPVNQAIINMWPYLEKCLPAVIEEKLNALKDLYIVYDLDNIEATSIMQTVPALPPHVDYKVLCGQDPTMHAISCIILQVSLNEAEVEKMTNSGSDASSEKTGDRSPPSTVLSSDDETTNLKLT